MFVQLAIENLLQNMDYKNIVIKKYLALLKKKTNHQCNICNKFLSSKQNLDNHLFNHRLDNLKIGLNIIDNLENNNLEDNLINNNLEDNLINNNLEDNLINNNLEDNTIQITIEEYNYYKSLKDELNKANNEINKLKDENKKLNSRTINNSTTINNIGNITNIDNSTNITNNIQINIIPFCEVSIHIEDIVETIKDSNSALHDFSKIFNYDHLSYPKLQSGLNFSQRCKDAKLRKIIANNRKRNIPLVSRGFIDILSRHFLRPECKNIKQITRNMYKSYNGNDTWILITLDDTKKELHKKVIKSMIDNHMPNSIPLQLENAIKFIKNDFYKNHQEYGHYHNNEFIAMIKNI